MEHHIECNMKPFQNEVFSIIIIIKIGEIC